MNPLVLTLKGREARRIRAGHPWVFANEVDRVEPQGCEAGLCRILDDSGRALGQGYFNKHSLICARLLTTSTDVAIDEAFFEERLEKALAKRRRDYIEGEAFRWVFGEADGLAGLVIDRYPGVVVVQVTTRGMEELRPLWEAALVQLAGPVQRVFRNDTQLRLRENLPLYVAYPDGLPPERVDFLEAGAPMVALPCHGQKTGFFLDHRENRLWLRRFAQGASVLDLFCYTGAWGLSLLHAGALAATFVDSSNTALEGARHAAARGGFVERCDFRKQDVTRVLADLKKAGEQFDLVVVDPPDLIPTRKSLIPGRRRMLQLFASAVESVTPGGYAALCSCSYHMAKDDFAGLLAESVRKSGRTAALVWQGSAAVDHPRPVALPESDYLKCSILRVD
jgi:23S rRNA (cytosine1962-C5)-methyltransferase